MLRVSGVAAARRRVQDQHKFIGAVREDLSGSLTDRSRESGGGRDAALDGDACDRRRLDGCREEDAQAAVGRLLDFYVVEAFGSGRAEPGEHRLRPC